MPEQETQEATNMELISPHHIVIEASSSKHAQSTKDEPVSVQIQIKVGEDLSSAVEAYGEEFIYNNYVRNVVIASQGKVRRELDKSRDPKEVYDELNDLNPTEQRTPVALSPMEAAMRNFAKMSPEEKQAFLESLPS